MAVTCGHWAGRTGGLSRKFCWQNSQHRCNRPSLLHDPGRLPVLQGPISEHKDPKKTTNKKTHSEHSLNPSLQKRTRILNHLEEMWCLFFPESCDIYTHLQVGFVTIQKIPDRPERKRRKKKKGKVTSDSQVHFSLSFLHLSFFESETCLFLLVQFIDLLFKMFHRFQKCRGVGSIQSSQELDRTTAIKPNFKAVLFKA